MKIMGYSRYIKLKNLIEEYIIEAISANSKGVMHELLVGYHLNGGKHMDKHPNAEGDSPEQAHDKLKAEMTPDEYKQAHARAKSAAEHIKKHLNIKNIHKVSWTSKPGDLKRTTGINASQKEDASDIVITSNDDSHPSGFRHHGVSLKVTDKKPSAGEVPVSNPGLESTYGGKEILDKHRKQLIKNHPALGKATNKAERKEYIAKNPRAAAEIKKANSRVLHDIVDHMHSQLSSMHPEELVHHLRNHVLHAHPTPMQAAGHNHIRHTTYGDGSHAAMDPAKSHEHILSTPEHITMEKKGTSVVFYHKGIPFARHRMKYESQSDPLSSIKGSGEIIKSKKN
jgi:hypothetical protein